MNRLEVRAFQAAALNAHGASSLGLEVLIDGESLGRGLTVDFRELYRTLRHSSEMWLWTSADGEPTDVGIEEFVAVDRRSNSVHWEWFFPLRRREALAGESRAIRKASFDRVAYDQSIQHAWLKINALFKAEPGLRFTPSTMNPEQMLALPGWLESDDAQPWQGEFLTTSFQHC